MARSSAVKDDQNLPVAEELEVSETDVFAQAAAEGEWETVARESGTRIVFDTVGDVFVGTFLGSEHVVPDKGGEEFDMFNFKGPDGELYSINHSYKLVRAMSQVQEGQMCRITLCRLIDVKGQPSPMKDFRVDVRK